MGLFRVCNFPFQLLIRIVRKNAQLFLSIVFFLYLRITLQWLGNLTQYKAVNNMKDLLFPRTVISIQLLIVLYLYRMVGMGSLFLGCRGYRQLPSLGNGKPSHVSTH